MKKPTSSGKFWILLIDDAHAACKPRAIDQRCVQMFLKLMRAEADALDAGDVEYPKPAMGLTSDVLVLLEECQHYFDKLQSQRIRWSFTANHAYLGSVGIDGFLDALDLARCDKVRLADCRGHVEEHLQPADGTIDFATMIKRIEGMGFEGHQANAFGSLVDMLKGRDYLVEQGYEVAIVRDATAAAQVPEGDGHLAAIINYRFFANAVWWMEDAMRHNASAA